VIHVNGTLRVPRSRGAVSGVALILLGAWGALIPFVGPYFHYAYTPDTGWSYTSGRFWLEILPGAGALVGGLIVLASSYRPVAMFGGWLAALSGGWFAVGSVLGPAWTGAGMTAGAPVGGTMLRAVEQLGFFTGLGVAVVFFATLPLGRFSVVSVRDTRLAAAAKTKPAGPAEERPAEEKAERARPRLPNLRGRPAAETKKPAEDKADRTGIRLPRLRGRPAAETEEPARERVRSAAR
jgi:hypothetical protein